MFKRSELPDGLDWRVLKAKWGSLLQGGRSAHTRSPDWWGGNRVVCPESVINPLVPAGLGPRAGGQQAVIFSTCRGVLLSTKQLKDMAQDNVYSPWGGTKGPWLCFRDKLLVLYLAWLLSFLSTVSYLIKFALWNSGKASDTKVFLQTRGRGRMGSQQAWVEHRGESGRSGCSELGIHREEVAGKSWPRRCPASSQKEVDSSATWKGGWAHDPAGTHHRWTLSLE